MVVLGGVAVATAAVASTFAGGCSGGDVDGDGGAGYGGGDGGGDAGYGGGDNGGEGVVGVVVELDKKKLLKVSLAFNYGKIIRYFRRTTK